MLSDGTGICMTQSASLHKHEAQCVCVNGVAGTWYAVKSVKSLAELLAGDVR